MVDEAGAPLRTVARRTVRGPGVFMAEKGCDSIATMATVDYHSYHRNFRE